MINEIIDGISEAIYEEFGDGYNIYTESVEQGLEEPCFSITVVQPTNSLFRGKRYHRENTFCIYYFADTSDTTAESMAVIDRLYDCLEYITVDGDLTMGTGMRAEKAELDTWAFFVNYDMFMIKTDETDNMEELQLEEEVQ